MTADRNLDLSRIDAKLDTLVRLLAIGIATDDHLTLQQRAVRLRRAGIMPKEIAELCGSTPNAVSVALSTADAKTKKKKNKKEEGPDGEG
jgi:DNA-directed RNA polymerase specialized sigma24 family protein